MADPSVPPPSNAASLQPSLGPQRAPAWRFGAGVIAVSLLAAGFAIAFRAALSHVLAATTLTGDVVASIRSLPFGVRVALPALGGLAAGVFGALSSRFAKSQGVGDVMEAVVLGRVKLSLRATLLRSLASWCAIASGGSIGREGPLIQFGGAIGQFVGNRLQMSAGQCRRLIAAGVGAGFAAAYNTPFAAVLFVIEIVMGVVVLDTILPTLIATAIATALTRASVGEGAIYGQRVFQLRAPLELVAFAGLGVAAALVSLGFMQLLAAGERAFRKLAWPLPLRAASGGLLTGLCVALVPDIAGNGYEPLNVLLDGELSASFVLVLLLGKAFATTTSVASGSPGGVFTPTLLIGGTCGFLYAIVLSHFAQLGAYGGYALVGMAAAIAATTHAPLMAAVLAFELSGDYAIVLPLVLATALATLVSRRLRRESIYAAELKRRGVAWELTLEGRRILK